MFHSRNAVLDDGIYLPKFLFCANKSNSKSTSPAAALNPATAIDGQPFCTSTSPSGSLAKKTLIIDDASLEIYEDYGERIALLRRLQLAGFKIFLRSAPTAENPSVFHKLDDDLRNANLLHNLSNFDKTKDYNELAKQGIERDSSLLLGEENFYNHIAKIKEAFYQNGFSGPLSGNNLRCEFRSFSDDEFRSICNEIDPLNSSFSKWFMFYFRKGTRAQRDMLCNLNTRSFLDGSLVPIKKLAEDSFKDVSFHLDWIFQVIEHLYPNRKDDLINCVKSRSYENIVILLKIFPDRREEFLSYFTSIELSERGKLILDICKNGAEDFFRNSSIGSSVMNLNTDGTVFYLYYFLRALNLEDDLPEEFLENVILNCANDDRKYDEDNHNKLVYLYDLDKFADQILCICHKKYPEYVKKISGHLSSVNMERVEYFTRASIESKNLIAYNEHLPSEIIVQINEGVMDGSLDWLSTNEFLNANNPSNTKAKPTYLDIAGLNHADKTSALFAKSAAGDFANIATIRFSNYDDKSADGKVQAQQIANVIKYISQNRSENALGCELRHIVLPLVSYQDRQITEALTTLNDKVSHEFFDYANYLGIIDQIREVRDRRKNELRNIDTMPAPDTSERLSGQSTKIRLAQGSLPNELILNSSDEHKDEAFVMALAGEVLNDSSFDPQIRTTIIERDITKNLAQKEYVPSKFSRVTQIKSLKESEITDLKKKDRSQIYCQFNLPLTANKRFRLPSFSASETLFGVLGRTGNLTIERGDDDFFYATSTIGQTLTYVVQAENPKSDIISYARLFSDHPIKKIIDDYRNPRKGFAEQAAGPKLKVEENLESHQDVMEKMFDDRSGVCGNRVAAVEYKLISKGIDRKNFRAVRINNNHVVLEIKPSDKWIKVDLGGGEAEIRDAAKDEVYSSNSILEKKPLNEPMLQNLSGREETQKQSGENLKISKQQLNLEEIALEETIQRKQHLESMSKALLNIEKLEKVENAEDLKTKTIHSNNGKILIVTKKIEDHANFLLHEATKEKREVFYIDSPSKIDLHRTNLLIANDNFPFLSTEGLLSKFLENAKNPQAKKPLLVINWDAFNNKQKVALNTVLDLNGSINGEKIDGPIQIIGFSSKASQDPSFLSRHDLSLESEIDLPVLETKNSEEKTPIDLQGFPNWRRFLFGKIVLVEDKMQWQKSDFVQALERGENNFAVTNLSKQAAQELEKEFAQAKALGKFTYHGYNIDLPEGAEITYKSNSFDFAKFSDASKISVANDVTLDQAPFDAKLINSHLFDFLLCDKEIENSNYIETAGFIEKAKDQTLKLFISSVLSESQWYCLFNESQKHNVQLELHLAPQVKVPNNVKTENLEKTETKKSSNVAQSFVRLFSGTKTKSLAKSEAKKSSNVAQIFVTNDCDKTLANLLKDGEERKGEPTKFFAVVDVEDCTYQDLIEKITFKITESGFTDFKKSESEFLTKLQEGGKIVLRGQFSPDLLQMLEPILTSEIGKNLTLLIEGSASDELKWLAPSNYTIERHYETKTSFTEIPYLERADTSDDLENSKEKAENFIAARKESLLQNLQSNSMVRLTGHSGVGKSSLIREFEKESKTAIYRELTNLEAWATDKSDKRKILFIDESNIEDRHFTTFSALKNGGAQRIFYQGKFHDLDENHKIVFAHNELEYGGGRLRQKLFDDGKIPALLLRDFPASYIYEKVLKEAIFDNLQPEIKTHIPESDFREICSNFISEYQKINSATKDKEANPETVRELQNKVLVTVSQSLRKPQGKIESKNFISTSATKEVEQALGTALNIKLSQKLGDFPQHSVGLNGVLLEGDSGTGKSELIAAMLASKKITEIKLGETADSQKQQFYKIDANLSLEQKREIIVKAFEEGNIVWIDEINSCIDDGLEKLLNAALTGDHPDAKKGVETKAGFMLISSINSAGLEGRSLISPALLHRTIQPSVKSLKEYSQDDLSKIVEHWLKPELKEIDAELITNISRNIAEDFSACLHAKGGENLNLRMLRGTLDKVLLTYAPNLSEEIASVLLEKMDISKLVNHKSYLGHYDPEIVEQISSSYKPSELQLKLISNSGDDFESCLSDIIEKRYEATTTPSNKTHPSEGVKVASKILGKNLIN